MATPGLPFAVQYTVPNHGSNPAAGDWTDSLYLSRDMVLDS